VFSNQFMPISLPPPRIRFSHILGGLGCRV
jgi:hypothetical protein